MNKLRQNSILKCLSVIFFLAAGSLLSFSAASCGSEKESLYDQFNKADLTQDWQTVTKKWSNKSHIVLWGNGFISGKQQWTEFLEAVERKEETEILIFNAVKETKDSSNVRISLFDIQYDGNIFSCYERDSLDPQIIRKESYQYLFCFQDIQAGTDHLLFVLADKKDLTYHEVSEYWYGAVSKPALKCQLIYITEQR